MAKRREMALVPAGNEGGVISMRPRALRFAPQPRAALSSDTSTIKDAAKTFPSKSRGCARSDPQTLAPSLLSRRATALPMPEVAVHDNVEGRFDGQVAVITGAGFAYALSVN